MLEVMLVLHSTASEIESRLLLLADRYFSKRVVIVRDSRRIHVLAWLFHRVGEIALVVNSR